MQRAIFFATFFFKKKVDTKKTKPQSSDNRRNIIFSGTRIVNHAAPVESEREIVGVALAVSVANHIARHVLKLFLDGNHIARLLHGEQTLRLKFASNDIAERAVADAVANQNCVGGGLNFAENHGLIGGDNCDNGNGSFGGVDAFAAVIDALGIERVDNLRSLAVVGAILARVTGNRMAADGWRISDVVAVLQGNRNVAFLRVVANPVELVAGGNRVADKRQHHIALINSFRLEADNIFGHSHRLTVAVDAAKSANPVSHDVEIFLHNVKVDGQRPAGGRVRIERLDFSRLAVDHRNVNRGLAVVRSLMNNSVCIFEHDDRFEL